MHKTGIAGILLSVLLTGGTVFAVVSPSVLADNDEALTEEVGQIPENFPLCGFVTDGTANITVSIEALDAGEGMHYISDLLTISDSVTGAVLQEYLHIYDQTEVLPVVSLFYEDGILTECVEDPAKAMVTLYRIGDASQNYRILETESVSFLNTIRMEKIRSLQYAMTAPEEESSDTEDAESSEEESESSETAETDASETTDAEASETEDAESSEAEETVISESEETESADTEASVDSESAETEASESEESLTEASPAPEAESSEELLTSELASDEAEETMTSEADESGEEESAEPEDAEAVITEEETASSESIPKAVAVGADVADSGDIAETEAAVTDIETEPLTAEEPADPSDAAESEGSSLDVN